MWLEEEQCRATVFVFTTCSRGRVKAQPFGTYGKRRRVSWNNRRTMRAGRRLERENIHDQIRFAVQQNGELVHPSENRFYVLTRRSRTLRDDNSSLQVKAHHCPRPGYSQPVSPTAVINRKNCSHVRRSEQVTHDLGRMRQWRSGASEGGG